MNVNMLTPHKPYKYKFWGLPIGVSILPRLAAMVCKTIIGINKFCFSHFPKIIIVKGTNVISATSFVINILEKKQMNTNVILSCHTFFVFFNNL